MKIRIMGVLLSVCLLLSGCGNAKSAETEPTPQPTETQNQAEETPTEPEETPYIPGNTDFDWENGYYQYGNVPFNAPAGDYLFYDGQVIFYGIIGHPLYAFDLTTGEVSLFCAKDGCDHSGDKCVYIKRHMDSVEQYGGTLYRTYSGHVYELQQNGKWKEVLKKNVWKFWHADGDLYAIDRDKVLQVCRGGTGEPEILMEDYDYYWNFVFDGYLYSGTYEELVRVDLNAETLSKEVLLTDVCYRVDGDYIYYLDEEYYLYRCKMDGTNSALLFDKPVLPASMNFDDEYFYFRLYTGRDFYEGEDSHDIYRFPKSQPSKIEKIATLEESVWQIFTVPQTGKIFVTTCAPVHSMLDPIYCMNTDGSNVTKLEFPVK